MNDADILDAITAALAEALTQRGLPSFVYIPDPMGTEEIVLEESIIRHLDQSKEYRIKIVESQLLIYTRYSHFLPQAKPLIYDLDNPATTIEAVADLVIMDSFNKC